MKLTALVIATATIVGTVAASAQSIELRTGQDRDRGYVDRDRDSRDWRDGRAQYRNRDGVVIRRDRDERRYDRDRYERRRPGIVIQ
jgi:hypothetical protein